MNKTLGSIMIVSGTAIGAAMLGLPLGAAGAGFFWAAALLVSLWALSYTMALIVMEVTLCFKGPASFSTMSRETLGLPGQLLMNATFMLLLYSLSVAYIVGGASLLDNMLISVNIHLDPNLQKIIFASTLGLFVFWSTAAVDYMNRLFFISKIIIFVLVLLGIASFIQVDYYQTALSDYHYLYAAVPVFFTAFGYHVIIPSISHYLGNDKAKVKKVLFWGSAIPMLMYVAWLLLSFGMLPRVGATSFASIVHNGADAGPFIDAIANLTHKSWLVVGLNAVSDLAITTSFLGVALGLFDFLKDALKRSDSQADRAITITVTLLPPLLVAILYPNFLVMLGYAGMFFTVSGLILPTMMLFKVRTDNRFQSPYRLPGGYVVPTLVLLAGVGIIALQVLFVMDKLPKL